MSSRISPTTRRVRRRFALFAASLSAALGCSSERLVAAVIPDAGQDALPCVPDTRAVSDMGIDIHFLLDRSDDMHSEWTAIRSWLIGLSDFNEFAGIGVGFTTTPAFLTPDPTCVEPCASDCRCLWRCGCETTEKREGLCTCVSGTIEACAPEAYATPTLPIGRLRETQAQLRLALLNIAPPDFGSTAFRGLFQGSLQYRDEYETAHVGRRVTQVVIGASFDSGTNGGLCGDRPSELEKILLANAKQTKTYVVGINVNDGDLDDFERIAVAGRTEHATNAKFDTPWPGGPPVPPPENKLPDLLRKIRATEGRCEYLLPTTALGFDADEVNLAISGQNPSSLVRVKDRTACSTNALGWYYEYDGQQPVRILTCENTCAAIHQAQSNGSAQLQTGCPSVTTLDAGRP